MGTALPGVKAVWKFFTGLRTFLCAATAGPPRGGTWYNDHHDILAHREVMTLILSIEAFCTSSSERMLREANV